MKFPHNLHDSDKPNNQSSLLGILNVKHKISFLFVCLFVFKEKKLTYTQAISHLLLVTLCSRKVGLVQREACHMPLASKRWPVPYMNQVSLFAWGLTTPKKHPVGAGHVRKTSKWFSMGKWKFSLDHAGSELRDWVQLCGQSSN